MPERMDLPDFSKMFAKLAEDVRKLQRHEHIVEINPEVDAERLPSYTWQSPFTLTPGLGHRFFADRSGVIEFCRAERSSGDGTSTAILDVLKNGTTIFPNAARPQVPAGDSLGPERHPDNPTFSKGDALRMQIVSTGGGTGPLRVTIYFSHP